MAGSTRSLASCRLQAAWLNECIFAARCPIAEQQCRAAAPPAFAISATRSSRCYLHELTVDLPRNTPVDVQLPSRHDAAEPIVRVASLSKTFGSRGETVKALVGVDLSSNGARHSDWSASPAAARRPRPRIARPHHSGRGLHRRTRRPAAGCRCTTRPRDQLKALQIVFQNPDSALNRRHTVRRLISRPLSRLAGLSGAQLRERWPTGTVRAHGGASPDAASEPAVRRPQAASGDRARLRGGPRIVVCDEPTSASTCRCRRQYSTCWSISRPKSR